MEIIVEAGGSKEDIGSQVEAMRAVSDLFSKEYFS